jgi:hypothetical protein
MKEFQILLFWLLNLSGVPLTYLRDALNAASKE